MSDDWINLIPEVAGYVPAVEKQKLVLHKFRELAPCADEVEIKLSDEIRFVDCGSNFEAVYCPDCGKELSSEWWKSEMHKEVQDEFEDTGFRLRPIKLPCCGVTKNLHQLRYHWPQGFAKFSVEAMNPNIGKLTPQQISSFEAILDCPLRVIYQHI